jgi:hypothetical protein
VPLCERTIAAMAFLFVIAGPGTSLAGQQPPSSALSLERVRLLLQSQAEVQIAPEPDRKLGFVTLVPPTTSGEMIRVRVPIGELVGRAGHAINKARRHRAERAARDEVTRSVAEFLSKQPR